MKIGIIGAGFTGLAAAYELTQAGCEVTVFESAAKPGGLAGGFRVRNWTWAIEQHYHHLFVSDWAIRKLAEKVDHEISFSRPKTSIMIDDKIYQLDSPISLMQFPQVPLSSRFRTGLTLFYLKATGNWKNLEKVTARNFLIKYMGEKSWTVLWKPLFEGKFGVYADDIPASWFWARIKKRSASLGYPVRGFEDLAITIAQKIQDTGGVILYDKKVQKITKNKHFAIELEDSSVFDFDKVICTLPTGLFIKITPDLPQSYRNKLIKLEGLAALTMVISLKNKFFKDNTYWLNVNERRLPFLAVVEHTNLVDPSYYNNEHLLYVGNYLPLDHQYFKLSETELLKTYSDGLREINPDFDKSWINDTYLFKADFAQPIVPLNYSEKIPDIQTPFLGLYLANMQQVYPWDRGTNYAVELGQKVATYIKKQL